MSPAPSEKVCPVCRLEGVAVTGIASAVPRQSMTVDDMTHSDDAHSVHCPACGEYVVTRQDRINLQSPRLRPVWDPLRLSALLRERATYRYADDSFPVTWLQYGTGPYGPLRWDGLLPIDLDELLSSWPRTVSERLDRVLCNIARMSPTAGHFVDLADITNDGRLPLLFASTKKEADYHLKALTDLHRLEVGTDKDGRNPYRLTPGGWDRFDELTRRASSPEHPVFVAMWYGVDDIEEPNDMSKEQMTRVYMEGIRPAVERAGYHVNRVDLEEFNDSIMDQVFGDIRAAPFVVADFTGHRNGVYLEAGFARGLGRPVIHTCAESHFHDAHFDTRHVNHICWKDPADLKERLFHRIRGTVGFGPYYRADIPAAK